MRTPISLYLPPGFQRYDCQLCGACCRAGFAVVTTEEERERIRAQGWEQLPEFQGKELFVRRPGGEYVVGQREDGACLFLGDDGLCRIHAKYGEEAKPFACRPYPFILLPVGGEVRASLRFDCPAVVANEGRPLPQHRAHLQTLAAHALPKGARPPAPPPFREGLMLEWRELSLVAAAFDRLIAAESLDITRRLLVCADLAGLLQQAKMADLEGRKLEGFLSNLTRWLIEGVAANPLERKRPAGGVLPMFRQAAGLYVRLDRIAETQEGVATRLARVTRRLSHALRLLGGWGTVPPVREGLPRVRWSAMERPFGIPDAECAEVLARYYRVKLDALGFCGRAMYGWPFLEGAGALFHTYPLILWFARLFAIGKGKERLDAEEVRQAIRVVDRPHGTSVALSVRTERIRLRFLSQHENLSTLIVWYGT